jgi:catechol 2,3-dioxygenase-like lactoylglutathione lyase family enzyme
MNFQRFEHVNLSCRDIHTTQQFYQTLFPDWFVRTEGAGWTHFGNEQFYLSLFAESSHTPRTHQPYHSIGVNHIGFVIQNGEVMREILDKNGIAYEVNNDAPETKFRVYLFDPDGNEIELIEYAKEYAMR